MTSAFGMALEKTELVRNTHISNGGADGQLVRNLQICPSHLHDNVCDLQCGDQSILNVVIYFDRWDARWDVRGFGTRAVQDRDGCSASNQSGGDDRAE